MKQKENLLPLDAIFGNMTGIKQLCQFENENFSKVDGGLNYFVGIKENGAF